MLLNWGIEARKWQLVIHRIQPLGWPQAFQATLAGTTWAFFTPNRTGEYLGRVLYLPSGNRLRAVSLTLVTSLAQLIITLFMGGLGLLNLRVNRAAAETSRAWETLWVDAFFWGVASVLVFLTLFYFRFSVLMKWIRKISRNKNVVRAVGVLDNFNSSLLGEILGLSFLRYLVFILQYQLLFLAFKVQLQPLEVMGSVSVLFLVMAVIPTIALFTELGVRWKASMEIFRLFSDNILGILATSLTIWLVNLVIPALIGSVLLLKIRFFSDQSAPAATPEALNAEHHKADIHP